MVPLETRGGVRIGCVANAPVSPDYICISSLHSVGLLRMKSQSSFQGTSPSASSDSHHALALPPLLVVQPLGGSIEVLGGLVPRTKRTTRASVTSALAEAWPMCHKALQ